MGQCPRRAAMATVQAVYENSSAADVAVICKRRAAMAIVQAIYANTCATADAVSASGEPQWQWYKRSKQTRVRQLKPYLQAAGRNGTTIINLCKRECGSRSRYLQAAGCNGNGASDLCKRECDRCSRICKRRAAMAMLQAIYANMRAVIVAVSASSGPQWQRYKQSMQTRGCGSHTSKQQAASSTQRACGGQPCQSGVGTP